VSWFDWLLSPDLLNQIFMGLSRTVILFIVTSGLSLILGVLRIPNVFHGSLYMIGAFIAYTISKLTGGSDWGFLLALIGAPLGVGLISLLVERGLFQFLYEREHLMLILFTFAFSLVFADMVKFVWGTDFKSVPVPSVFSGFVPLFGGSPVPKYNVFLLAIGPLVAIGLWLLTKTKIGKIAQAAAVDREMVGAVGTNVSWVFASVFIIGCLLAAFGGVLVAPTVGVSLGMDFSLVMEGFLIVIIGGLGNIWGALVGSLIFGLSQSLGILIWPQFGVLFPYLAVIAVLLVRPKGLLRSTW
jgi:branched-chain amino acid transport system permease protein